MECPDIYQYNDYRAFLQDLYLQRKAKLTRYSYRKLSTELGFPKTNYIHLVVQGKRNLSLQAIEKVSSAFGWRVVQKRYFRHLVHFNQAKSEREREKYHNEIEKILGKRRRRLHPDEYAFFNNWYLIALREIVTFKNFVPNYNWIAKILNPSVKEALIKDGIKILQRLNMIRKEGKNWIQTDEHLTTDAETQSHFIHNYFTEMLRLAKEALHLPSEDRDISAITMGLTPEQFQKLKQRLIDFRYEIQNEAQEQSEPPSIVAQLNIQLFPLTKLPTKKAK